MNILSNAIDAFEDLNQHRTYQEIAANPNKIQIQTELTADRQVCIRIEDNGTGIPQAILDKIFDPFFTTKEVGKETGLGLAISYKVIVEKHGGSLRCHSQPGMGTQFLIQIPLVQPEF
jgi:signal transduction histidine kinase